MKKTLIMQENEFSGTISMYPSTMQPFCAHVDKLVASNFQICFPAPFLRLHAKYSHMPNISRGRTSPGLPYVTFLNSDAQTFDLYMKLFYPRSDRSSFEIILLGEERAGPEVIKLFHAQLLLINFKMPTIVGILTFISMINITSERLKARNFCTFRYFSFSEQLKFRAHLSLA